MVQKTIVVYENLSRKLRPLQLSSLKVCLISLFQETRVSIRLLLLQAFGALCGIDAVIVSELLNSVHPVELARDMQTHVDGKYA